MVQVFLSISFTWAFSFRLCIGMFSVVVCRWSYIDTVYYSLEMVERSNVHAEHGP